MFSQRTEIVGDQLLNVGVVSGLDGSLGVLSPKTGPQLGVKFQLEPLVLALRGITLGFEPPS